MEKMENLYHENRNDFWKYLKSIRGQSERENLPQLDNLIDHFKILLNKDEANKTLHEENMNTECSISDNREFPQRQEYDYDYVNGRIKLQTQHYLTGIPFKSYRNPFYITVKQQITVIAI